MRWNQKCLYLRMVPIHLCLLRDGFLTNLVFERKLDTYTVCVEVRTRNLTFGIPRG